MTKAPMQPASVNRLKSPMNILSFLLDLFRPGTSPGDGHESDWDKLVFLCQGDEASARSLTKGEMDRNPGMSRKEAISRAYRILVNQRSR